MTKPCTSCPYGADDHRIFGQPINPELWHHITSGRVSPRDTLPQPLRPGDVYLVRGQVWPDAPVEVPAQRVDKKDLQHQP